MVRTSFYTFLLAVAAAVGSQLGASPAMAGNARRGESADLFYNYYVEPGYGGLSAQMYLCPRPTPPLVGHTYITYQPLLPHEFLYHHHRTYYRNNGEAGITTTHVQWWHGPIPAFGNRLWDNHSSSQKGTLQ